MENLSNQSPHDTRLYLVVAQGLTLRDLMPNATPLSKKLRMLRRRSWRVLFIACLGAALVEWVLGYRGRHIIIATDEIAIDRHFYGCGYLSPNQVFDQYPNVLGWAVITSKTPIDLGVYLDRKYSRWSKSIIWNAVGRLLSAATRGLIPHDNCISLTREAMSQADVKLPRRIYSPAKLVLWLTENGYDFFTTEPTENGRPVD